MAEVCEGREVEAREWEVWEGVARCWRVRLLMVGEK